MMPEMMLGVGKGRLQWRSDHPTPSPSPNFQDREATGAPAPTLRPVRASDKGQSPPLPRTCPAPSDTAGPQSSRFWHTGFLAAVTGPALG